MVTVNCARIVHANQVATNGVVHVIDGVISPVSGTIKGFLDVEDQLSSFSVRTLSLSPPQKSETRRMPTRDELCASRWQR